MPKKKGGKKGKAKEAEEPEPLAEPVRDFGKSSPPLVHTLLVVVNAVNPGCWLLAAGLCCC